MTAALAAVPFGTYLTALFLSKQVVVVVLPAAVAAALAVPVDDDDDGDDVVASNLDLSSLRLTNVSILASLKLAIARLRGDAC